MALLHHSHISTLSSFLTLALPKLRVTTSVAPSTANFFPNKS
jgi:hypothetical protein